MSEQTIANTSVAAEVGTMKRAIQMKNFNTDAIRRRVMGMAPGDGETLGQIIGTIFKVQIKEFEQKDGNTQKSRLGIGEFEATSYHDGVVMESTAAYLPDYYLETIEAMLEGDVKAINFAIEIVLVATGKNIPVAYEVKNLIRRRPENPLNQMKLELKKAGRLRLPPPVENASIMLENEIREIPAEEIVNNDDVEGPADDEALAARPDPKPRLGKGLGKTTE